MPSVSIIRSDRKGPANESMLRYHNQHNRKDPEAIILKEYQQEYQKKDLKKFQVMF